MTGKPAIPVITEQTEAGAQTLVSGVPPVGPRERLERLASRPMAPKRNRYAEQKPCDVGLFDTVARDQTDLIDWLKTRA